MRYRVTLASERRSVVVPVGNSSQRGWEYRSGAAGALEAAGGPGRAFLFVSGYPCKMQFR
jgi:hypothetical protein